MFTTNEGKWSFDFDRREIEFAGAGTNQYIIESSYASRTSGGQSSRIVIWMMPPFYQPPSIDFGVLHFWDPVVIDITKIGDEVVVSWLGEANAPKSATIDGVFMKGTTEVWREAAETSTAQQDGRLRFDARAFDDVAGELILVADYSIPVQNGVPPIGSILHMSRRIPFTGTEGEPLSRNAQCSVFTGSSLLPLASCPFTNGLYDDAQFGRILCSQADCTNSAAIQVDLGASLPVSAVFLHGVSEFPMTELSEDGIEWIRLPELKGIVGAQAYWKGEQQLSARYLRISSSRITSGGFGLAEVSVW